MKYTFLIVIFSLSVLSCREKESIANTTLKLSFANLMVNNPLQLQNIVYTNALGNSFSVEQFKYYISNIKLKNMQTGQVFIEPNSYHLLERKTNTHIDEILIKNIPVGQYDQIEFSVGIDKEHNLSTDQVGDLDPSNNMAWDWKTGYKFLLLEGNVLLKTGEKRGLVIHIGTDENYRNIVFNLNQLANKPSLILEENKTTKVNINVDVARIFNAPNLIDIEQNRTIMFDGISGLVSDNYATMFNIQGIER